MFDLSKEQNECVRHGEGPLQIIAGAGSGKTRVLTERVIDLIQRGIPAERILAMAFNKKAQVEMLERIVARVGEETASKVWVRTFHSFGYQIVNENAHMFGFRGRVGVMTGGQQQFFAERALQEVGLDPENDMGALFASIRYAKRHDMDAQQYHAHVRETKEGSTALALAYAAYERQKRQENIIDFDDMIFLARRALVSNATVLKRWQDAFSYVLIDEFQDVDDAQFDIIRLLAFPENNLTVVGDPDQSIYSFRGANPSFTINFKSHFPTAHIVFLNRNYRSTQPIIAVSNQLIERNLNRVPKALISETASDDAPFGQVFGSAESEAKWVAQNVREAVDNGDDAGRFACIYRTNAQAAFVEAALMRLGLPYVVMGGFSFYDRKEVMDLVAYLSLAVNGDNESFERVYNRPNRYLGKAFLKSMQGIGGNHLEVCRKFAAFKSEFRGAHVARNVEALVRIVDSIRLSINNPMTHDVADMLEAIVKATKYEDFLRKSLGDDDADNDVMGNVRTLIEVAEGFDSVERFIEFVSGMREANKKAAEGDTTGLVKLMTIHKSKGLEFPCVFVIGLSEGLLPHRMAEEVEEERRLAYVAMTRAKEHLRVSAIRSYNGSDREPSRFINESGITVEGMTQEELEKVYA